MSEDSSPKKLGQFTALSDQSAIAEMRHELSQIHEILSQFALENKRLNQIVTKLELSNAELGHTNAKLSIENNRLTQDLEAANSRILVLEDSLSRSWREKERSEKGGTGTSGGGIPAMTHPLVAMEAVEMVAIWGQSPIKHSIWSFFRLPIGI